MAKRPQSVAIGVRSFRAGEIAHDDRRQHCQEQRRPPPRVEGRLLQPRWARHVSSSSSTCACACGSFTSSSPAAAASLLLRVDPSSSAGESSMFRHDRDSVLVRHARLAVAIVVRRPRVATPIHVLLLPLSVPFCSPKFSFGGAGGQSGQTSRGKRKTDRRGQRQRISAFSRERVAWRGCLTLSLARPFSHTLHCALAEHQIKMI